MSIKSNLHSSLRASGEAIQAWWKFLCFAMTMGTLAFSQSFKAYVDKTILEKGEAIVLNLEYNEITSKNPDLSLLREDFNIIDQSQGQETSIINGHKEVKTTWTLTMLPKKPQEKMIIPSIYLGGKQTQPINITISNERVHRANQASDLNLLAYTDIKEAYINAEIILTLELKTEKPLRQMALEDPVLIDAIIEPLGEGQQEEVVENGLLLFRFVKRYAIFPTKIGTLKIPKIVIRGKIIQKTFGFGFFDRAQNVYSESDELFITIKPPPLKFPKGLPFLPAKSLAITESFMEAEPKFEKGKATTRNFQIIAKGVLKTFLPKIKDPNVKNLKIYVEEGRREQELNFDGIVSKANISHIYMPEGGGDYVVPLEVIYWWNTEKDELKMATVRELIFKAEGSPIEIKKDEIVSKEEKSEMENTIDELKANASNNRNLLIFSVLFTLLFLVLVALLIAFIKKLKPKKDLIYYCNKNDVMKVYKLLLAMRNEKLKDLEEDLALIIYKNSDVDSKELLKRIKRVYLENKEERKKKILLDPLYPC